MTLLHRIVLGCLALLVAAEVQAQTPGAPAPRRVRSPYGSAVRPRYWHEDFMPSQSYGFRNPGGVGRMSEYYPPGVQFQNEREGTPHVTARIGLGGVPDRREQLQSQVVGTVRSNALQMHTDRYGAPQPGYGLGYGYGFGYPW
jgi:hypothetical protein